MNPYTPQANLILGWLWIVLGFLSGSIIGLNFNFFRDDWLGGYSGLKRRLYRLGHISFFGLALVNFIFYFTARLFAEPGVMLKVASWGFIVGAITMPICCFVMAHFPRLKNLFYIPVMSLLTSGFFTLWEVVTR
ncbi:MAG: hypothetical protein V3U24_09950 [Candidatus Neomarinimicrobiota bacterium]